MKSSKSGKLGKLGKSNQVLIPTINKRGTIEFNGVADSSRKKMIIRYIDICHKYNINPNITTLFVIFEFLTKIKGVICAKLKKKL